MAFMPWILLFLCAMAGEWMFSMAGSAARGAFCRRVCGAAASVLTMVMLISVVMAVVAAAYRL
ncbi:hypothetical protein STSP2_00194 [Anaerohalosphaera lusitana]|uniref:Uncharacterized protein n=1 Tax=Anaerohalosphaera lusitana TaxID=1936003 RepID=A0A1U9NH38_9BACT|nr:hypothetical protein [Anaerohalosphaera lusitana]AQT67054.1 hypothetical protein STSP2_00194 [Anaerohalosphaera lusitana]